MLALAAVPSLIQFIWMFRMPESPRWLAKVMRYDDCFEVLNRVYDKDSAKEEYDQLKSEMQRM